MPHRTSIARLVIVTLVSVTTLMLGLLGAVNYLSQSQYQHAKLDGETTTLTRQLAEGLALPLWNFDRPQVDRIIESVMEAPQVYGVIVRQPDVSAPGGSAIHARVRDSNWAAVLADHEFSGAGMLVKELPVMASGELMGTVRVFATPKFLESNLRRDLLSLGGRIIALNLIMVLILYVLLRRTVLMPLRVVEQHAALVSEGARPRPVQGRRFYGELESLRLSIERMIELLDARYTELKFNEEQFRLLFDQSLVGIIICDALCDESGKPVDFRLVRANPAYEKLTGHTRAETIGKTGAELTWTWPRPLTDQLLALAFSGGHLTYDRFNEGLGRYYEVRAFSPRKGQFALIFSDITERTNAQAAVLEAEKMRTVAGLAAGMAHEINNPLAGILQSAEVVLNRVSPELAVNRIAAQESGTDIAAVQKYFQRRGIVELLEVIQTSGQRAAGIVANMLRFSRKSDSQLQPCSFAELLDRTAELAASEYDSAKDYDFRKIDLVREYDAALPEVSCRATEIQQVLLNLLKNAAQAMAQRGERNDPPRIIFRAKAEEDGVRIEVEDNGVGIPEALRGQVFEPFFTTKESQGGTGLGLFVSYLIVTRNHGGTLTVSSVEGKGTKFVMTLPLGRKT